MATGGVKEERATRDPVRPDGGASDDDVRRLEAEVEALERKKKIAELTARSGTLNEELANLTLHVPEPAPGPGETNRDSSPEDRGRARSVSRERPGHRRRCRAHHSSSDSSRERTPSRERRLKRKWQIRAYNEDKRDTNKLNPFELVESSCNWMADQDNPTAKDYKKCVQHISFICSKCKSFRFTDKTHVLYDKGVRKLCVKEGYAAFGTGNSALALKYYCFENMKSKNAQPTSKVSQTRSVHVKDGKRPCYSWNGEAGCSISEPECQYGHWCSKCGARSHKNTKCKRD